jgi:adenylate cyclase
VFALQDKVTERVVSAIQPKMLQTEMDLAARRPNDLSAYDLCLRAVSHLDSRRRGGSVEALRLVSRALEIDPRYGFAATLAGICRFVNVGLEWTVDPTYEIAEGFRLLRLALSIDPNDPEASSRLGRVTASFSGDFDTGKELVDRAVAFNPNASIAWGDRGWTYLVAGEPEEAIRSFERVIRLSPFDPWHFGTFTGMSMAFIGLGRFDDAIAMAKKALSQSQSFAMSYCCLVSALVHLGRETEARDAAIGLLKLKPDFCMSEWMASRSRWRTPIFFDGLRRAGLPA